jgi:hypothetical protein
MFELTKDESENLRSQFGTSSWGGSRNLPMVFTEQGVAMLLGILNSDRAIEVNIAIMRAFVHLRRMIVSHEDLPKKLSELESHFEDYDEKIKAIFKVIHELITPDDKTRRKIGFTVKEK